MFLVPKQCAKRWIVGALPTVSGLGREKGVSHQWRLCKNLLKFVIKMFFG